MENNFIFKGGVTRYWWIPLITGVLAIAIGVWCLLNPIESLPILALVFACGLCAVGIFNLSFALANSKLYPGWGWALAMGILEIICGMWMLFLSPAVMTTVFVYAVGIYIVFACINAICDAFTSYGYSNDWFGWIIAVLLITLLFALIFMAGPIADGVAVWIYIGISFIFYGIYRIIFSAKIRRLNNRMKK